jgi:hypothetical protein
MYQLLFVIFSTNENNATNFKCCVIILSIAANNCLLHVPSIATNTNLMQLLCITSKNCWLHYNINYCHQQLLVACDLCHHQHKYVTIYIYYHED